MKSKCFTLIIEVEMVKIVINGLDYSIREKLVNQQFLDMAQLTEKLGRLSNGELKKE